MSETFEQWQIRLEQYAMGKDLVIDAHPNDLRYLYLNWYPVEMAILEIKMESE
jgi:hypothetical protein